MLKNFFKQNYPFFLVFAVVIAIVGYILLHNDRSQIHLAINALVGNPVVDVFFKYMTYVGDGVFVIVLGVIMVLFFNIRRGLIVLIAYTTASLFTTLLKRGFYDDVNRPHYVFHYFRHQELNYVDGVEKLIHNSFPSGHSTAAFAMFFALIFMTKRPALKWLFFVTAFVAAFSRTYLSQHWLIDIYAGSIIGVCFSTAVYLSLYHRPFMHGLDRPLIRRLIN